MGSLSLDLRPSKAPEVALGPGLLRGTKTVHVVLDRRRGRLYEMGAREHFLLSRLDGRQTLSEIGDQYADRFGRRLGDAEWTRLLVLLGSRNLLAGQAPMGETGKRPVPAPGAPPSIWQGDQPLPHLAALARLLQSRLPGRVRGLILAAAAVAGLGIFAVVTDRLPELLSQAADLREVPWLVTPLLALLLLGGLCHELAHALVAVHRGAEDVRIGVRWRLLRVSGYCHSEEVQVLPRRRQRASVALAGPLSHGVFLIPFFAAWLALPSGELRDAVAALLLVHSALGLVNLVPWPGTDGYLAISAALNMSHLGPESLRYLRLAIHRGDARVGYPARARPAYLGYPAVLVLGNGALLAAVGWLGLYLAGAR